MYYYAPKLRRRILDRLRQAYLGLTGQITDREINWYKKRVIALENALQPSRKEQIERLYK